jgi:hypothetical protein
MMTRAMYRLFSDMATPRKKLIRELRSIAASLGARCHFTKHMMGGCHIEANRIAVGLKNIKSNAELISIFFHEIGHVWCYQNGRYKIYHSNATLKTKSAQKKHKRLALRAEVFADKVGERLCEDYYPLTKYQRSYREEWQKFLFRALL